MSDVNIEQVREVANKPIAPLEQVWRDLVCKMADEIERLRAENAELKRKLSQAQEVALMDNDEVDAMVSATGGNDEQR